MWWVVLVEDVGKDMAVREQGEGARLQDWYDLLIRGQTSIHRGWLHAHIVLHRSSLLAILLLYRQVLARRNERPIAQKVAATTWRSISRCPRVRVCKAGVQSEMPPRRLGLEDTIVADVYQDR